MKKVKESGIITIGAQSIFCSIIDLKTLTEYERVAYDVDVGTDLFNGNEVKTTTVNQLCEALLTIKRLLNDYQIKDVAIVGSDAIHEAKNAEFVRDQILVRTGFFMEWTNKSQESLYRNEAAMVYVKGFRKIISKPTVLIDVNPGNVELTAYANQHFLFSRNLKLGPQRIYELMYSIKQSVADYTNVLRDYIGSQLIEFERFLPDDLHFENLILVGASIIPFKELFTRESRLTVKQKDPNHPSLKLNRDQFTKVYQDGMQGNDQYLMDKYDLSQDLVTQVVPTLLLLKELFDLLDIDMIWVSALRLADGVAVNHAISEGYQIEDWDRDQATVTSALNLSNRYHVDTAHRDSTVKFSLQLFDRLKSIHGLGKESRMLLHVAALLNDVGSYIDTHNHYFHSDYIIRSSEIVGLSNTEQTIVAAVARYHSTDTPSAELKHFDELSMQNRMTIAKLTALLRIADALDASRQQKITEISVSIKDVDVVITAKARTNIELEKFEFNQKGEFFEAVFGMHPELKGRGKL